MIFKYFSIQKLSPSTVQAHSGPEALPVRSQEIARDITQFWASGQTTLPKIIVVLVDIFGRLAPYRLDRFILRCGDSLSVTDAVATFDY